MIKPQGNRAVLQLTKNYIFENKKPVMDEDGNQRYIIDQPAKVLSSNIPDIKKGMTVYPIIRGGVPISAAGVEVPGRAAGMEGLDAQHENERQSEKLPHFFHGKEVSDAN